MKKLIISLAIFTLIGCEPFKEPVPEFQSTSRSDEVYLNNHVSDTEIVIFNGNLNSQSVKRVEDKDAVCWVLMNTKNWEGGISCIPRSLLTVSTEEPTL